MISKRVRLTDEQKRELKHGDKLIGYNTGDEYMIRRDGDRIEAYGGPNKWVNVFKLSLSYPLDDTLSKATDL